MIADYFWKVIFLVLLIIGLNYWFDWRDEVNSYNDIRPFSFDERNRARERSKINS